MFIFAHLRNCFTKLDGISKVMQKRYTYTFHIEGGHFVETMKF